MRALIPLTALLALTAPVLAAPPCPSADACDTAAKQAFAAGRLEDALARWRDTLAHGRAANVEFNIANALAFLDDVDDAIAAFERFVTDYPADPRHALAQRLLAQLRARARTPVHIAADLAGTPIIVRDATASHSGLAPLTHPVDPRGPLHIHVGTPPDPAATLPLPDYAPAGWWSLGGGAALGVLAVTFALLADDAYDDADALTAEAHREQDDTDVRVDRVNARSDAAAAYEVAAYTTGVLSIVALTAGGVLLWLDARLPAEGTLRVGPTGAAAAWSF